MTNTGYNEEILWITNNAILHFYGSDYCTNSDDELEYLELKFGKTAAENTAGWISPN